MNRRSFLQTLAAVVVAPLVATAAPKAVPSVAQRLVFHRDAFASVMEPLWRVDVIYGWADLRPQLACRVLS